MLRQLGGWSKHSSDHFRVACQLPRISYPCQVATSRTVITRTEGFGKAAQSTGLLLGRRTLIEDRAVLLVTFYFRNPAMSPIAHSIVAESELP